MIACDPKQTTDVSLPDDAETPADRRPTFVYRHFTARELLDRDQAFAAVENLTTDRERIDAYVRALAVGLVGWRNVTDPAGTPLVFDPAKLPDALTPLEMGELFAEAAAQTRLSEAEKKSLRLAARIAPAPSAKNAAIKAVA